MNEENNGYVIDEKLASIRFDDLIVKPSEDESIPDLMNRNNDKIYAIIWRVALIKGMLLGWFD